METRYLTVVGSIEPDGQLALQPAFLVEVDEELEPGRTVASQDGTIAVEIVDRTQQPLARYQLPVGTVCEEGTPTGRLVVMGRVPYDDAMRGMRFYRDGSLVAERTVSGRKPNARFLWKPPRRVGGQVRVSWAANAAADEPLTYVLSYRERTSKSWVPLSLPTTSTEQVVDFDALPPGRARLGLSATDGVNARFVKTATFEIRPAG